MALDEHQLSSVLAGFKEDIIKAFDQRIGIAEENFQHKLEIVAEGVQMLGERMDRVETRLERVEEKVDKVSLELAAHRSDTEAHHGVYRVKEG